MASQETMAHLLPVAINYLDWGNPTASNGKVGVSKNEVTIHFSKQAQIHLKSISAGRGLIGDPGRRLLALVNFAEPFMLNACRWSGDIEPLASNVDEHGMAECILVSMGYEHSESYLVNEKGNLTRTDWERGIQLSQVWRTWKAGDHPLMLYQVDSKGEVRSVELQVTLPQGDCGMEPAFSLQPLPPWQIFVPYLGDRESRLIVVEFAFESMPVLRVKADVDEDRLRTFGLFANRRFLARSGDKVDLEFDKRGFSEPIVIAGV